MRLTDKCVFRYRQSATAGFLCLNCAQRFDYDTLGSSRNIVGAPEHLIDGSERICRFSFEFLLEAACYLASHADVLRLVTSSSPRVRGEELVTSLRTSAWEATCY